MPFVLVSTTGTPAVTFSPTSLNFGKLPVGTTSAPQSATLTNTGGAALTIGSIQLAGAAASDYVEANTCGTSLSTGSSCTITVTFTPSAAGVRNATVNVTDNATGSPQKLALLGQGT
jgi:hypothetical protein